ncbi:MAG: EthD domain-containing protein [Deltaproteobacteria bacterium]|nr:EthD domain-containing protein [Deltaproteobacteria bacterium]
MENMMYVIWKDPEISPKEYKDEFLAGPAKELRALDPAKLSLSFADEQIEFALDSRFTSMDNPIAGMVSLWLDTHLNRAPFEEIIRANTLSYSAYLILESMPIVNTEQVAPLGERTPGLNTVGFLKKPQRLTYDEWIAIWQGSHTQVAFDTQCTFMYTQNVVVRALTEDAEPWTAIVEEGFPEEALRDPLVFYAADGDEAVLAKNAKAMVESCARFIDFPELESHRFSEYNLK